MHRGWAIIARIAAEIAALRGALSWFMLQPSVAGGKQVAL
jgi:hypothetical protein